MQKKNYWNNSEKPQQNTVKTHCRKALENATAKPKQNYANTNKEYAEDIQNTIKNEKPLLVYVNGFHYILAGTWNIRNNK